jgi:hypothetical protein
MRTTPSDCTSTETARTSAPMLEPVVTPAVPAPAGPPVRAAATGAAPDSPRALAATVGG